MGSKRARSSAGRPATRNGPARASKPRRPAKAARARGARPAAIPAAAYEALFDAAFDPVLILRAKDGRVVRGNTAAAFALGWSPDELAGKSREELLVQDDALRVAMAERGRKGLVRAELRVKRADGSSYLAQVTSALLPGPGEPLAYALFRDVGAERAAAQALVEAEQRFAAVFDRAPLAMALSRFPEGTYVAVNDAWRKLFELEGVDVVGKTGVELGIASPEAWGRTTSELHREGSIRGREVLRRTKSGQAKSLLLSLEPLFIGGRRHVVSLTQDVTAQRATEAALRACEERVRTSER